MKFNYSGTDRWTCCQWGRVSFVSISGHVSPEVAEESRTVQVETTKEGWEEKWEEENNKTNNDKKEPHFICRVAALGGDEGFFV